MVGDWKGTSLEGFSAPVSFKAESLVDLANDPGVHVVWSSRDEMIYVGYASQQRTRIQQHLSGGRQASVIHKYVGELLDDELNRNASRDDIRAWLERCTIAWKSDPQPQILKASVIEEFHPIFNEVLPIGEADSGSEDVWDEFIYWARFFFEAPEFDANERDYKLHLADLFAAARSEFHNAPTAWIELLTKAFRSRENNISRWNQHDEYLKWVTANPEAASDSLNALWGSDTGFPANVDRWADLTPKQATSGAGARTMLASLLLAGQDPTEFPPYKPMALRDGYRLVGFEPEPRASEGSIYVHALSFFDRIIEECLKRGLVLRDRLDAQGLLWAILNTELEEGDAADRLTAFRGRSVVGVWWVNQGQTYEQERRGGFVWAPQRTDKGAVLGHWLNVSKLDEGELILHYANGAIRAIGVVRKRGAPSEKPRDLGDAWGQDGYRADVDYFDLKDTIQIVEIPEAERIAEAGPFNRNGGVNQGYLYPLSGTFADTMFDQFRQRWPAGSPWALFDGSYWIFQGNPEVWDFDTGLREADMAGASDWSVTRYRDQITDGDLVAIWKSGPTAGVYAIAEVEGVAFVRDEPGGFTRSTPDEEWAIGLRNFEALAQPVLREAMVHDPVLKDLDVIRIRQGTNFPATKEQWERLSDLMWGTVAPEGSLVDVVGSVSGGLLDAGLGFGSGHLGFVRSFVVSLATKGFVLLTGLSGSGKSRLALGFGEWLGVGRFWVEAVRPDWTGPDALLGFPDGLSARDEHGRLGWHVPGVLEFMLGAAADDQHPYLLLLDEMNLAHVERYFADVLSGMESGAVVLPNLERGGDGVWREKLGGSSRLKFPPNLLVVGTVNIDETTYMFSPKVLDRANTMEFRVGSEDLVASADPIGLVEAGSDELVRVFLEAATSVGGDWSGRDDMAGWLRELHGLLAGEDREFGHRVFFEALRFGGLLAEAGDSDPLVALDLQVMQKVLPRIHGSIRQVGSILELLGAWCFYGPGIPLAEGFDPVDPPEGEPRLPVSFDKIARMTRRLRANHFVSYAE